MTRRHDADGRRRRLLRRDQSGAAMVEFALVVGLFAFILTALISFGMALATKQRVTSAAADGARAAVGAPDLAAAMTQAEERVITKLGTTGYSATYIDEPACVAPAKCIKVTIVYDLPALPLLPAQTTSSAVVQYA